MITNHHALALERLFADWAALYATENTYFTFCLLSIRSKKWIVSPSLIHCNICLTFWLIYTGFVGEGMLTAAVAGSVFASPPPSHILTAICNVAAVSPGKEFAI